MTTVVLEIAMDLHDPEFKYANFIAQLRKLFLSEVSKFHQTTGAHFVGRVKHIFVDVRINLGEGRFLKIRLKTDNVYYVAWRREENDPKQWFVMDDNSDKLADFLTKEEKETGWVQRSLGFGCSYDEEGIGDYEEMDVSRTTMLGVMIGMYYYNSNRTPLSTIKKGCRMIATCICEPLRYGFLEEKIDRAWKAGQAYVFIGDDKEFIQSWSTVSKLLREKSPTKEEIEMWEKWDVDGDRRGRVLLDKADRRKEAILKWDTKVVDYCKNHHVKRSKFFALLLDEGEEDD